MIDVVLSHLERLTDDIELMVCPESDANTLGNSREFANGNALRAVGQKERP